MVETALDYLNRDILSNVGLINVIQRGGAHIIHATSQGVYLVDKPSHSYMLSADNLEAGTALLSFPKEEDFYLVVQPFMVDYLQQNFSIHTAMPCYLATYTGKGLLPENRALEIKPLSMEYLPFVMKHYDNPLADEAYIKDRLSSGNIFGGFTGGFDEPVGFIGYHGESSLGILTVLEEQKGKGYGRGLVHYLINKTLRETKIYPYSQIFKDNTAAIQFHKKLGFELSPDVVYLID